MIGGICVKNRGNGHAVVGGGCEDQFEVRTAFPAGRIEGDALFARERGGAVNRFRVCGQRPKREAVRQFFRGCGEHKALFVEDDDFVDQVLDFADLMGRDHDGAFLVGVGRQQAA